MLFTSSRDFAVMYYLCAICICHTNLYYDLFMQDKRSCEESYQWLRAAQVVVFCVS